jgi:hypothetical protein
MNRLLAFSHPAGSDLPDSGQTPQKKFMAAPVTIEDQGSFFIGGMTKVTDYAAVPFAPPGQTPPARCRSRSPSARCTSSSRSRCRNPVRVAGDHGPRLHPHRRGAGIDP